MRASVSSNVVLTAAIAGLGLAALYGCSGEPVEPPQTMLPGQSGAGPGPGTAGTGPQGTSGTVGASGSTGAGGGSNTAGAGPGAAGAGPGAGGISGQGGSTGTAGAGTAGAGTAGAGTAGAGVGGGGGGGDITKVAPSGGCGKAFAGTAGGKNTMQTMGTKDANCAAHLNGQPKCGAWSTPRDYYVYLPQNYDMTKPYTLVFLGPGCGGNGSNIYPYDNNVGNTIIRVGLTPGPNSLGHGTNENQGCFDDKEGDDSIDWVFYENLYDKLNAEGGLCFDKNRVFAGGNSSGAWFSNELGCKYAGDATRPVRGIMPNTGGLPAEAQYKPTCTTKGMAGMWIHETGDTTNGFDGNQRAITRALATNSCTAQTYEQAVAQFQPFDIGGSQACKRIGGCDPLFPLVVCPLNGNGHGSHDDVVNPGVAAFLKLFQAAPLLTP